MTMAESIINLRKCGWSDTEIVDYILYILTDDEQYNTRNEDA